MTTDVRLLRQRLLAVFVLIDRKAGHQLTVVVFQLRLQLRARAKTAGAASVEGAARRWIQRARQLTGKLDALAAVIRV